MVNKSLFLIVNFFILNYSAYAQNEQYSGGLGKGDGTNKTNSVYLFNQPASIYFGGNGKGDQSLISNQNYINGENISNPFKGGVGRGDLNSVSMQVYFNNELAGLPYTGGNGRGDEKKISNPIYFNSEFVNVLFAGGNGRGDNTIVSSQLFFNSEFRNIPFLGGAGKGDNSLLSDASYFNGESLNSFYRGGIGKGDVSAIRNQDNIQVGPVTLGLNLFIEGFYLGSGLMQAAIDQIHFPTLCDVVAVVLHDAFFPYNTAYNISQNISTNGSGIYSFLPEVKNHSYYIALRHRNALETWSATPVFFGSTRVNYSFTDLITKAYGSNMSNLGDGNFALWSGDISDAATAIIGLQDGVVESQDYSDMENAVLISLLGYNPQDLTGDGVVESMDYSLMENNVFYTVSLIRP